MAAIHAPISSHTSPHILTPSTSSTTNKPLAPLPALAPATISTQKHWVIPPRPKPGRKPALDAPPTKRKAQNREAQRAFRERRAAKVGELEDQMKEMEEEDARERNELRDRIRMLEEDVDHWKETSEVWHRRCSEAEEMLGRERQVMQGLELEVQMVRGGMSGSTDAVPLPSRRHRHNTAAPVQQTETNQNDEEGGNLTCGRCSGDSRCQCIEEAFEMSNITTLNHGNFKRPHSPPKSLQNSKRFRQTDESNEEPTEVDFTTCQPPRLPTTNSSSSIPTTTAPVDDCGFCSNGTACICAEIRRQEQYEQRRQIKAENTANARTSQNQGSCTMNPGSCSQCQSNPISKTFCTTLAASRTVNPQANGTSAPTNGATDMSPPSIYFGTGGTLNCADAFTTLAHHPSFARASTQLSSWVPQLATRSVPVASNNTSHLEGRTAFEIEAASVMEVMKTFDRRYGDGAVERESGRG